MIGIMTWRDDPVTKGLIAAIQLKDNDAVVIDMDNISASLRECDSVIFLMLDLESQEKLPLVKITENTVYVYKSDENRVAIDGDYTLAYIGIPTENDPEDNTEFILDCMGCLSREGKEGKQETEVQLL